MKTKKLLQIAFLAIFLSLSFISSVNAQEEVMTNDEVITLSKAGLNQSIIVNKIRTSKTNFDMSTDALIKLKKAGISDEIVNAMLEAKSGRTVTTNGGGNSSENRASGDPNDPMSPHGYGIYLYEEKDGARKMTQIQPTVSAQNRTGGIFTSQLTYGIGKVKTKANLPGRNSKLQITETKPTFYFYLDKNSGGLNTSSGIPSTPQEFALIRFNIRSDNREVTIGKANVFGAKGGLSDEYVVQFNAEDLGNGVFKITPTAELKKGEYGFFLINSGNSNASSAVGSKFFDFGVNMMP